jgi:hypothetical protein
MSDLFADVTEQKVRKNCLHLDIKIAKGRPDRERRDRIEAEATRLSAAGGTIARRVDGPDGSWIVMHDVERNEFCVI